MSGETPDGGAVARYARFALAFALFGLASIKGYSISRTTSSPEVMGLGDVLRSKEVTLIATIAEAALAIGLLTRWSTRAADAVIAWIAILIGVALAMLMTGTVTSSCGCFGPREVGWPVRASLIAGMLFLSVLARREPRVRTVS